MKATRIAPACVAVCVVALIGLPLIAVAIPPPSTESPCTELADDGSPSILGPSVLSVADLRAWWASSGREQPRRLRLAIADLIAVYLTEGAAEGVRGDLAFAQAILETGHFTNSDTAINNFAGIAHYDGASSGTGFSSPLIGVRAQVQLLKKYALGNNATLAHPNVAPRAGASATTWAQLAGTWATDTRYWTSLRGLFDSMSAGETRSALPAAKSPLQTDCVIAADTIVGAYALPVERRWYDEHPDWFTRPHHDYPAIDLPVPTGTPLFAVTAGVIVGTPTGGKCGIGIIFNGDDGAQYTYCHGRPGSQTASVGDRIAVGQHILDSASTGNSTGQHLHLGIEIDGIQRCPQSALQAIAAQRHVDLRSSFAGCVA